jgi:hypothetical protein
MFKPFVVAKLTYAGIMSGLFSRFVSVAVDGLAPVISAITADVIPDVS